MNDGYQMRINPEWLKADYVLIANYPGAPSIAQQIQDARDGQARELKKLPKHVRRTYRRAST